MAGLPRPVHEQWVGFLSFGAISVNHWIVDIGVSSRVSNQRWLFIAGVLLAGMVGFLWMVPTSNGMMIQVIPIILGARLGVGFVHFLYSRWVWNFSDPAVSATIGRSVKYTPEASRTSARDENIRLCKHQVREG